MRGAGLVAGVLLIGLGSSAMATGEPRYEINPDGASYQSPDGTGEIVLDFKRAQFDIVAGGEHLKVPLGKSYQERGEFFFITRAHAVWVCKARVDVPAEWNKSGKAGFAPETPVVLFFENGKEKYRLLRSDLGFTELLHHPETVRSLPSGPSKIRETESWLSVFRADVPDRSNMLVSTARFLPRLFLQEARQGRSVQIELMHGRVGVPDAVAKFPPRP